MTCWVAPIPVILRVTFAVWNFFNSHTVRNSMYYLRCLITTTNRKWNKAYQIAAIPMTLTYLQGYSATAFSDVILCTAVLQLRLQLMYSRNQFFEYPSCVAWWLSGRALDLQLTGRSSIPSRSAFTKQVNSALHPSGVTISSTCFGWG